MTTQTFRSGRLGEVFQSNRVPIALIGVGIAWLLASNTRLVVRDERVQAARRPIGEIGVGDSQPEAGAGHSGQIPGPSGEPAIGAGDAGRTDGWVHQAAGAARGAISSVRDAGNAVLDRAGGITDYAGNAGDLAKRAGGQLVEKIGRDPWLIGVVGLVAGALVAALVPSTKAEQEFIEEARDELRSKATEIGHEAAQRVGELAKTTTGTQRIRPVEV